MSVTKNRLLFKKRLRIILAFITFLIAILLVRVYFVQVVYGADYRNQAIRQYVRVNDAFYNRGSILFTDKDGREISAATIKTGYLLIINPEKIKNATSTYATLSSIIKIDKKTFIRKATKKNDSYEEIEHRVNSTLATKIREKRIPGVSLVAERWRYYPGGSLAATVLGFVAYNKNTLEGRYGLERYYNDVLKRESSNLYINFFAELFTNVGNSLFVPDRKQEGDIVTTIDPTVQLYLEKVMKETRTKWKSKFTAGIIMDPKTGEIRAMAVSPGFNLNTFRTANSAYFPNLLVQRVYEFGSIVKPLTIAAGLDSGAITPESTYNDTGSIEVNNFTISNYDKKARGVIPIQQILSQSLNVGAAYVEKKMGNDTFRRYMYRYKVNEETGIDLPNEARNLTKNLNSPRDVEYVTASFGQGIALTPINMIRALAVLPDGYLEQPHIVSSIHLRDGSTQKIDDSDMRQRVLKPKTVEEVTKMLVQVLDKALWRGSERMPNYSIAVKTGTAQIASPNGGYYKNRYLNSFFGYFPAYNARFIILLINVEPQGAKYASETLTVPFMDLTHFLINYYNIPPDR